MVFIDKRYSHYTYKYKMLKAGNNDLSVFIVGKR